MTTKARIENGKVMEILTADPFPPFHESLMWVECGVDVVVGWSYNGSFIAPNPTPILPTHLSDLTPRQIRMALSRAGLRATVEAAVAAGDQDLKDWWEWSQTFERLHPEVVSMGAALGQSVEQLDALWALGATL